MAYDNQKPNRSGKGSSVSVDEQVQQLFRNSKGKVNQSDFQNLRMRIGDESLVDKIQNKFVEKYTEITKKAKKFAQLIREKYSNSQYPFHILLEKAYKYKVKYGLTDAEFGEFQRIYENELIGLNSPDLFTPNTNLQKVLGNVNVDYQGFTSKLSENDFKILQEILKLHSTSKALHSQVLLQSIQYEDCGPEALTGKYERSRDNIFTHVHPVVAALFLPKIDTLEQHFLHSNISNIIKCRYNKEQFTTMPDALLYDALIKDPNDIACDSRSTILDLYNRAQLQNQLWNSVLSLRNGQYYNSSTKEFMSAVDLCRMNKYDTPDLVYGRYDGTILKRLLSAFSFRPTIVTTTTAFSPVSLNPYQQNIKPLVTFIHMINFKLPFYNNNAGVTYNLEDALEQTQYLIDQSGVPTPKHTSLIYSKGILVFYVDRRSNVIYQNKGVHGYAFNFSKLPTAIAGFERLNDSFVNFRESFPIRQDKYQLRSVVVSQINENSADKVVIGSRTLVVQPPNIEKGIYKPCYYQYDPIDVQETINPKVNPDNSFRNNPITAIGQVSTETMEGFNDQAHTRGIIFIYQLVEDKSSGTLVF